MFGTDSMSGEDEVQCLHDIFFSSSAGKCFMCTGVVTIATCCHSYACQQTGRNRQTGR